MAKTGFWLRGAQGKLAGAALQKGADGSTIIREVVTPKNPQTDAQMIQRILIATVGVAYASMKEIVDHSFEGVTKGAKTMNAFRSINSNILRDNLQQVITAGGDLYEALSFSPLGMRLFCLNNYQVSRGSLPQVPVLPFDEEDASGTAKIALSANTYGDLIKDYGLQRGDQLTFLVINQNAVGRGYTFHFARVILDPTLNEDVAPLTTALVESGAIKAPSVRNEGEMIFTFADGELSFKTPAGSMAGAAVIVSRKGADETWRRSDAQLVVRANDNGYSMGECLDRFVSGTLSTMSSTYLNNAGTGAVASTTQQGSSSDSGSTETPGGSEVPGGGDASEG